MNRISHRFRGLRWKLTFSYVVVTVATLLVVELLGLGLVIAVLSSGSLMPWLASTVVTDRAAELYPYLAGDSPDLSGLQIWLEKAVLEGSSPTGEASPQNSIFPGSLFEADASALVIDPNQTILAAHSGGESPARGARLEAPDPDTQRVLLAALAGEDNPARLFAAAPDRGLWFAAPIQSPGGEVAGALVLRGALLPVELPAAYSEFFSLFGASLVLFTLSAGVVGTVFGFLTARGLSRRLGTVSHAADAWSRGDFSVFVQDPSSDELGQMAQRLNRMAEQLQNLLQARQDLAALEERNRLARDLHDSVKQQVFATAMQVGAARTLMERDPQTARSHLEEAEQLARQAQAELSSLIQELRPVSLQGRGLVQALQEHLDGWSRRNQTEAKLSVQNERALPLAVEQALFRVAQEALANIARHAHASRVIVDLTWEAAGIRMAIADDGRGFDPQSVKGFGIGLNSMDERITALGGQLEVSSQPGRGTRLGVYIPLSPTLKAQ